MLRELLEAPLDVGACLAIRGGQRFPTAKSVGTCRVAKSDTPIELFESSPVPFVLVDSSIKYGAAELIFGASDKSKAQDSLEGFYLPWAGHSVYRMSLKEEHQPRLFFTAPLDGCAVVIEGTPEKPVIYHANANQVHPDDSPLGDRSLVEPRALSLLEDRNAAMFSAYRAFPGHLDSFSDARNAGAVTPLEYGVLIGRPSEAEERRALERNWQQPQWKTKTRWSKEPSDWTFHKSFGTVFGVRAASGSWAFFRQKVVELKEGAFVLSCQEFWPSGFRRSTV
jgi:hypothetical protein